MLAAIGGHFGWPEADLAGLTQERMAFWLHALSGYHEKVKVAPR